MAKRPNYLPNPSQEALLQAILLPGPKWEQAYLQWKRIMPWDDIDFSQFRLLPLLFHRLKAEGYQDELSAKLKGVLRFQWAKNQLLMNFAGETARTLKEWGTPFLFLKGMALALSVYGDPKLRYMDDIDVLVPIQEARALIQRYLDSGFKTLPMGAPHFSEIHHACNLVSPKGQGLDIHWYPLVQTTWRGAELPFWEGARSEDFQGFEVLVPQASYLLLHTLVHGLCWNHVPPIRWIPDAVWTMRTKAAELDWDRLASLAKAYHVLPYLKAAMAYLEDQFEVQAPAGFKGRLNQSPMPYWDRKEFEMLKFPKFMGLVPTLLLRYSRNQAPQQERVKLRFRGFIPFLKDWYFFKRKRELLGFFVKKTLGKLRVRLGSQKGSNPNATLASPQGS